MDATIPAFILFLVVLVRVSVGLLRRIPEPEADRRPLCRLHTWERAQGGLICRRCGLEPSVD